MPLIYVIGTFFLHFVKSVNAKTCYRPDSVYEPFMCGMYEYCCGTRCCRSPIITFYQMWYFWLMVFLTVLFCSGGGWWYRLRNQDAYIAPSMTQRVTHTRPIVHPAHGPTIIAMPMPPVAPYGAQHPTQPPPPYYGPPPSYDTVVNMNQNQCLQSQVQYQNQQNQNRAPFQQN